MMIRMTDGRESKTHNSGPRCLRLSGSRFVEARWIQPPNTEFQDEQAKGATVSP